jgi:hypothetical protein
MQIASQIGFAIIQVRCRSDLRVRQLAVCVSVDRNNKFQTFLVPSRPRVAMYEFDWILP